MNPDKIKVIITWSIIISFDLIISSSTMKREQALVSSQKKRHPFESSWGICDVVHFPAQSFIAEHYQGGYDWYTMEVWAAMEGRRSHCPSVAPLVQRVIISWVASNTLYYISVLTANPESNPQISLVRLVFVKCESSPEKCIDVISSFNSDDLPCRLCMTWNRTSRCDVSCIERNDELFQIVKKKKKSYSGL